MVEFSNLSLFLKQQRIQKGYTQAELASSLKNVHSQFVSNWERGLCAPPTHCFQDLISLLKINRKKLEKVMLLDAKQEIQSRIYG
jgi:transcriptional regulator with XRE-family HTH domain